MENDVTNVPDSMSYLQGGVDSAMKGGAQNAIGGTMNPNPRPGGVAKSTATDVPVSVSFPGESNKTTVAQRQARPVVDNGFYPTGKAMGPASNLSVNGNVVGMTPSTPTLPMNDKTAILANIMDSAFGGVQDKPKTQLAGLQEQRKALFDTAVKFARERARGLDAGNSMKQTPILDNAIGETVSKQNVPAVQNPMEAPVGGVAAQSAGIQLQKDSTMGSSAETAFFSPREGHSIALPNGTDLNDDAAVNSAIAEASATSDLLDEIYG